MYDVAERRDRVNKLLKEAKDHVMTPREIWQQRVSFVYRQLMESEITRAQVEAHAVDQYGCCPIEILDSDYDDMLHALGRPKSALSERSGTYRNHFCCGANSYQSRRFEALGCWNFVRFINVHLENKDAVYEVNDIGKKLLARWMK